MRPLRTPAEAKQALATDHLVMFVGAAPIGLSQAAYGDLHRCCVSLSIKGLNSRARPLRVQSNGGQTASDQDEVPHLQLLFLFWPPSQSLLMVPLVVIGNSSSANADLSDLSATADLADLSATANLAIPWLCVFLRSANFSVDRRPTLFVKTQMGKWLPL